MQIPTHDPNNGNGFLMFDDMKIYVFARLK